LRTAFKGAGQATRATGGNLAGPLKLPANPQGKETTLKRISLFLAGALACLLFAAVGTAGAMPTEGIVNTSCSTSSNLVAGHKLTATVTGKNVDPTQMKYAECKIVKKVLNSVIKQELLKPAVVEGFRITPKMVKEAPLIVKYTGLFRGADTATEIKLAFKIEYANN
jgi:hypothetical protein